jgi:hypothetical protein
LWFLLSGVCQSCLRDPFDIVLLSGEPSKIIVQVFLGGLVMHTLLLLMAWLNFRNTQNYCCSFLKKDGPLIATWKVGSQLLFWVQIIYKCGIHNFENKFEFSLWMWRIAQHQKSPGFRPYLLTFQYNITMKKMDTIILLHGCDRCICCQTEKHPYILLSPSIL